MVNYSQQDVQKLNDELQSRHYEFISNCDHGKGDPSACHSYGEWLAAVDQNYETAAKVYEQNCTEKNYAASCFNLGRFHVTGKGVEQDDTKAFKLFQKACSIGHTQGCHHLGFMYMNGIGIEKDVKASAKYFEKACNIGDANSCYRLSSLYLSIDDKRNPVKAKEYLEKACDSNFAPACHNLAVMYRFGDQNVPKDEDKFAEFKEKTSRLIAEGGPLKGIQST